MSIQSKNVDQKSFDTELTKLPFVAKMATNGNRKHCFWWVLIPIRRLLRAFLIAAYPVWERNGGKESAFDINHSLRFLWYSYKSAYVLLNLLNLLGKRDKMQGLWAKCEACEHLLLFRNEFNKFNNTGTQMLDSTYHLTLKLLLIAFF